MLNEVQIKQLISSACQVRQNSYSPYSHFCVGAALLTAKGKIYVGTNIENISYPVGICAERSAFAVALSNGERNFVALALVGGSQSEKDIIKTFCTPCGMCRQFMAEFCGTDFPIITARSENDWKILTMKELLPHSFSTYLSIK